jgi:large subunit ribosomal protein L1
MNKKHKEKAALITKPNYPLDEAVSLLTEVSTSSFDGTAEAHIVLGIDPKAGDQQVRSTVALPNGTGKDVKIAAVVPDDKAKEMIAAGATHAGEASLISEIEKGNMDFDVLVAMPSVMRNLGKVAKSLGQKGLMPSPKAGTVTDDPIKTIQELKKGRVEFRADKQAIIHVIFGKISFGKDKLLENLNAILHALNEVKPSSLKNEYIKSITLCPSMGPGVKVDLGSIS